MIFVFCFLGILLGIFTGLVPGIHVNTVTIFALSFFPFSPINLSVMIIAMAITHTFFDFIPSILIGAPNPDTALSVLPGHRMFLEGRAVEAILLTMTGGLFSTFMSVLITPLLLLVIPLFYSYVSGYIHILIICILLSMLREGGIKAKFFGIFCFFLSGVLGLLVLNSHIIPANFVLFPVFTGLYGISTMLLSLGVDKKRPVQKNSKIEIPAKMAIIGSLKGVLGGVIVGTLPSVGSSQAALFVHQLSKKENVKEFLVSLGAVNTVVALFSMVSLYTISKARSGAAVAIERLLPEIQLPELILLIFVVLSAAGISSLILIIVSKKTVNLVQKIDYRKTTYGIIGFLIILTDWFTGFPGLLVLFTTTCIGLLPPLFGVKRTFNMGVLMLPTILFYSGLI